MKNIFFLLILVVSLFSCSSNRQVYNQTDREINNSIIIPDNQQENKNYTITSQETIILDEEKTIDSSELSVADKIVAMALSFEGYPYRFGGTTERGMDCSGVIYTAYVSEKILLPRVSREMAAKGQEVSLEHVKKGDLLFFKTPWNKHHINHVGLVVDVKDNEVFFIHSTTSKGVIISKMSEDFWKKTFLKATTLF